MPAPFARPLRRGSITVPPYLIDVLSWLRTHCGSEVWHNVEQISSHHYLIDVCDGSRLLVDTKHRMVEDSCDSVLMPGFPGRIEPEHCYTVTWEENGEVRSTCTEASSPALARLLVRAPADATVVEDP